MLLSSLVRWSAVQSPNLLFTCKTLKQTLHKEWTLDRSNLQLSAQYFLHSHCCKKYDKKYNWLFSSYNPIFKIKVWILNSEHVFKDQVDVLNILFLCMQCSAFANKYEISSLTTSISFMHICISINRLILFFDIMFSSKKYSVLW